MLRHKLIWRFLLAIFFLGIILLVVNNSAVQEGAPTESAFTHAKQNLFNEQKSSQNPGGCSQRYGTELISNYHHAQIDLCSGLQASKISCYVNNEYEQVPRILCTGNNTKIVTIFSHENHVEKKLIVDCNLQVYNWLPKELWYGEAMSQISTTVDLACSAYVEHPIFVLARYDYKNIYHILEDVVTTYETLLVLDLDPRDIELVIWDDFPTNNTLFQIWRTIFGKGVRILNENPLEEGTCFRRTIFNIHGDNSHLSNAGGVKRNTECSSPILKSLRHFIYQAVSTGMENERIPKPKVKLIGFISRQQYDPLRVVGRVLTNEPELISYIQTRLPENWRLIIIRPELMVTFKEQVEAFRKVDVLIGVHGAGLANVMFMQSGTHLIEVFHGDRSEVNRHYYNMCKWLGINYQSAGYFTNFVAPNKLWSILNTVIGNDGTEKAEQ